MNDLFDISNLAIFSDLNPRIVRDFEIFHAENPKVFDLFKSFAIQAKAAGRGRFGARAILERIRWHTAIETSDPEFKINNNFHPCYARLLVVDDPSFAGFFETRHTPGTVGQAA